MFQPRRKGEHAGVFEQVFSVLFLFTISGKQALLHRGSTSHENVHVCLIMSLSLSPSLEFGCICVYAGATLAQSHTVSPAVMCSAHTTPYTLHATHAIVMPTSSLCLCTPCTLLSLSLSLFTTTSVSLPPPEQHLSFLATSRAAHDSHAHIRQTKGEPTHPS